MKKKKFKTGEAIVFEPTWWKEEYRGKHPLVPEQIVYFISDIPNALGHCIVATYDGKVVPMVHPEDFRTATEDEV